MKSNKVVQFPMEGFDPSASLAERRVRPNSASNSESAAGVTTVNVRSSEQHQPEEEAGDKKEQTSRKGSEVRWLLYTCVHGGS